MAFFALRCDRYGPTWTGGDMVENFGDTKDYLGIIFPIAISAVGTSLMALVSAQTAGKARRHTATLLIIVGFFWASRRERS